MNATARIQATATHAAPATLLGQNLEVAADTVDGLMTERLTNPKFAGPAETYPGIAGGWLPGWSHTAPDQRFERAAGMFLSGRESQLIVNTSGREAGVLQTGRPIRRGESLELTVWARTQWRSVRVRVGIRPLAARMPDYATATLTIDATYWKCYRVTFPVPADDDAAVFFCVLMDRGMVWLDQVSLQPAGQGRVRPDLIEGMRSMQIPVLRFPGGCISNGYHWQYGTGPAHLRPVLPDPIFHWKVSYEFGIDEYLELCLSQGIRPHITANITSGTPEEAAEWAAYVAAFYRARGAELPVSYWHIGNENYGAWEYGNLTGPMYVELLKAFVPGIRAANPQARIIALGPETGEGEAADSRHPWRQPVLQGAGDLIDLIALQYYCCGWPPTEPTGTAAVFAWVNTMVQTVQKAIDDCRAIQPRVKVAMTEWNLWRRATHHDGQGFLEPYDVLHGLFVASALNQFTRLGPGLELTNFYNLVNPMGLFISRSPELVTSTTVDVFRLYRPGYPGDVHPVSVQGPDLTAGVPAVDAVCLSTPAGKCLHLVNRHATETVPLTIESPGRFPAGTTLRGPSPDANFVSEPADVKGSVVRLPPLSVTRLEGSL